MVSYPPAFTLYLHGYNFTDTGSERTIPAANYSTLPRVTRRAPRDSHRPHHVRSAPQASRIRAPVLHDRFARGTGSGLLCGLDHFMDFINVAARRCLREALRVVDERRRTSYRYITVTTGVEVPLLPRRALPCARLVVYIVMRDA